MTKNTASEHFSIKDPSLNIDRTKIVIHFVNTSPGIFLTVQLFTLANVEKHFWLVI